MAAFWSIWSTDTYSKDVESTKLRLPLWPLPFRLLHRLFLRGELESVDKSLPSLIAVLRSAGAGECSHKHGSFLEHLVDVYRILKMWKAQNSVCLCGLFHSAYSIAYVNLAIFDASTGRDVVRGHVGEVAERLIHLFCVVPRQTMIHDNLLFKYSDSELIEHLKLSETSPKNATENGIFDRNEPWRKKLRVLLTEDGIVVENIKSGEDVLITRKVMGVFLLMSMADYSDQFFGYQDLLFDNFDGKFKFLGDNYATLWPGDGKPGLWMNSISKIGAVYTLILIRDEAIIIEEKKRVNDIKVEEDIDEDLKLVVPPVFENCTKVLEPKEQVEARDFYWEAICNGSERAEELLLRCCEKNPFVGEPHVVLAQVYLNQGRYEEGDKEAEKGVILMLEWGESLGQENVMGRIDRLGKSFVA
ncbi:putative leucine-rich repeat receptor-like protein kinase [Hibiscus syriacus]|uniref:Leucine-rich repeat receptor-like protein kinase n=2 Tax=Hibiscus syriacus TaxID=106335 RepID=A0A6A3A2J4_HIBSY|nr:putative leucine-rich repeat receptor-like protein kinase [Hibiscus syriacus]